MIRQLPNTPAIKDENYCKLERALNDYHRMVRDGTLIPRKNKLQQVYVTYRFEDNGSNLWFLIFAEWNKDWDLCALQNHWSEEKRLYIWHYSFCAMYTFAVDMNTVLQRLWYGCNMSALGERSVRIPMVAHRPASFSPWFRRGFSLNSSKIGKLENQLFVAKNLQKTAIWAYSSAGRAYGSHP